MKKHVFLSVALCILCVLNALAQTAAKPFVSSIQLSYGVLNPQKFVAKKVFDFVGMEYQTFTNINSIYAKWLVNQDGNNVHFGPSISYSHSKLGADFIDSTSGFVTKHVIDNYVVNRYKFLMEFEHVVLQKKHFQGFYSVGLGARYTGSYNTNNDENTNYYTTKNFGFVQDKKIEPALQIVAGISYNLNRHFSADAMVGNTGTLLQLGLRYKLGAQ